MWGFIFGALGFILKLFGWNKSAAPPTPEEKLGQAETTAQAEEKARVETSAAIDARRAADAQRLRDEGTGATTVDPADAVNRDDGFRRD